LAAALEVSRGTVVRAYDDLRDRGCVETRQGAGTVVGTIDDAGRARLVETLRADGIVAAVGHRDPTTVDLRVATWDGDDDVLALLRMDPDLLAQAVRGHDGYWPLGLPPLRAAIADRLTMLGLPTDAEQVVVTNGSQQAVDTVLSTLTRPGDPVAVERTSWPGVFELLSVRHLRPWPVTEVARDHVPLLRVLRERRADVAYLVPSFHNPTGEVLAAPARRLVVEAAAEGGGVVIDDLTLAELWIDRPPPPPLAATVPDLAEHVITVGSLSKSLWGGLRLGWLRADGQVLRQLARVKTVFDLGAPVPAQLTALAALEHADGVVEARRTELRARRDAFVAALRHHLPTWRIPAPTGGLSMWVDLGEADGDTFAARATEHGVRVPPARACSVDGQDLGHLRLTLSRPVPELETAAERLARAWAARRPLSRPLVRAIG
jgi:DNA-binding transcriptional MocR family regulator